MVLTILTVLVIQAPLRAEEPADALPAGIDRSLFAASDCLLDVRGREIIDQVINSGGAVKDVAALTAIADLKRFTLAHAQVAIQHHFAGDALRGLARTLAYIGAKDGDGAANACTQLRARQGGVEAALGELGLQFEAVFPLVAAPPRNRIKDRSYDRDHFDKRYQGSRDFVAVTADMLARARALLGASQSIEREAWRSSYESFDQIDPSPFRQVHPTDRKSTSMERIGGSRDRASTRARISSRRPSAPAA